jgi:hypothetical protein
MSSRISIRLLAAAIASCLIMGALPAYGRPTLSKPPVRAHADTVPSVPGAAAQLSGALRAGSRVAGSPTKPLVTSEAITGQITGQMSGTNLITFDRFADGDMVVVEDPAGLTGHAGLFDHRYYVDIRSYAVLSANVAPANGVQREQCLKYRANDEAWGIWVPYQTDHRVAARNFAYSQMGKPYNILAAKTDLRSFYCSKLAWAAWRYTSGLDLDADGGYWVWPIDLVNSRYTRVFGYWG